MELIIIITKTVEDNADADTFARQVRTFVSNNPALNRPDIRIETETRDKIGSE